MLWVFLATALATSCDVLVPKLHITQGVDAPVDAAVIAYWPPGVSTSMVEHSSFTNLSTNETQSGVIAPLARNAVLLKAPVPWSPGDIVRVDIDSGGATLPGLIFSVSDAAPTEAFHPDVSLYEFSIHDDSQVLGPYLFYPLNPAQAFRGYDVVRLVARGYRASLFGVGGGDGEESLWYAPDGILVLADHSSPEFSCERSIPDLRTIELATVRARAVRANGTLGPWSTEDSGAMNAAPSRLSGCDHTPSTIWFSLLAPLIWRRRRHVIRPCQ